MAVWVALLRGINIGGRHRVSMAPLRSVLAEAGCRDPETYIQSGNVIFESTERKPARLAASIESAIESEFGFRPAAVLRTLSELDRAIAANPFPEEAVAAPEKLAVFFLRDLPAVCPESGLEEFARGGEQLRLSGRELYLFFPSGMGKSRIRLPSLEHHIRGRDGLPNAGTGRNWKTCLALLDLVRSRSAIAGKARPSPKPPRQANHFEV